MKPRPFSSRRTLLASLPILFSAAACGVDVATPEEIRELEQRVYVYSNIHLFTENNYEVPVCFLTAGFAAEKTTIQNVIEAAWEAHTRLDFTGWGTCPSPVPSRTVPIRLVSVGADNEFGGVAQPGMGSRLSGGTAQIELRITPNRNRLRSSAVHEMGHAIGLIHEHQRPDRADSVRNCLEHDETDPKPSDQETIIRGGVTHGAYDRASIMNYCRDMNGDGVADNDDNPDLSPLDIRGIQEVYGIPYEAGFVWSSQTTGSFTASAPFSWNSFGNSNTITRIGTGRYRVDFPKLGDTIGGNVQVTAYGGGTERCKVESWSASGTTLNAFVACSTTSGAAIDTLFTASYQRRADFPGVEGGYVWANQPTTSSYVATGPYKWNSTRGDITISRSGTGTYQVSFAGLAMSGGTTEVTAYGGGSEYCKVQSWFPSGSNQLVNVKCFSATGAAADTLFSLVFSGASPNRTRSFTYAWADQPIASSYTPNLTYQKGFVQSECSPPALGPVTITRSSTGTYQVNLPGMPFSNDPIQTFAKSNVKVTAYGSGSETCKIVGWGGSTSSSTANVACHGSSGAPVDTFFVIVFSSNTARIC